MKRLTIKDFLWAKPLHFAESNPLQVESSLNQHVTKKALSLISHFLSKDPINSSIKETNSLSEINFSHNLEFPLYLRTIPLSLRAVLLTSPDFIRKELTEIKAIFEKLKAFPLTPSPFLIEKPQLSQVNLFRATIGQVISKLLVYRDGEVKASFFNNTPGRELRIPYIQCTGQTPNSINLAQYIVETHIIAKGLVLDLYLPVAGENKEAPIYIAARGNSLAPSSRESWNGVVATLSTTNVGHDAFFKQGGKEKLEDLLEICTGISSSHPIVFFGHSLGGAVAKYAAITFPTQIQEVYAFDTPGNDKETSVALEQLSALHKQGHPVTDVKTFNTTGDFVPHFSGEGGHVGDLFEIDWGCKTKYAAHTGAGLLSPNYKIYVREALYYRSRIADTLHSSGQLVYRYFLMHS
ncbi:MAG: hypothetical protein K0S74_145 [Chlamydiales bacterium]|jgi:hypothetical protein|nr:hypothetical protein [Chlamydiales bacterium]